MKIAQRIFSLPIIKQIWYSLSLIFVLRRSHLPQIENEPIPMIWGTAEPVAIADFAVPKIIWSYWGGKSSPCVEACRKSWGKNQADFAIHILTPTTLRNFLPDFPDLPTTLPIEKVSNLIRLLLLERYGGIWMDGSILLTQSLDWVTKLIESNKCEMLAFYNEYPGEYRSNHDRPIIENGFLAALPNSRFISDWRKIYEECIQSQDYTKFFRMRNWDELTSNFLFSNKQSVDYLVCYIASQHVMIGSKFYRILLLDSLLEYYFHFYNVSPPRNKRKFSEELLLRDSIEAKAPRLIKIIRHHRIRVDEYIRHGCFRPTSLLGRYL